MPDKKKTPPAKSDEKRVTRPPATKPASPRPARDAGAGPAFDAGEQFSAFEAAMKQFHGRRLAQARELFAAAAAGPERDVANRARLHMAMCDRRLQQETVKLQSAEDYYNYGVALINTRKLTEARQNLEKALAMTPHADHVHYALALAQALGGDLETARWGGRMKVLQSHLATLPFGRIAPPILCALRSHAHAKAKDGIVRELSLLLKFHR